MVSSMKNLLLRKGNSSHSNASYHSILSGANNHAGGGAPSWNNNDTTSKQQMLNNSTFSNGGSSSILIPEKEIWRIFADMARSICHVHEKDFIHLDIKPANFLVTKDRTVKLGDFGRAIHISAIESNLMMEDDVEGDSIYMAPELLTKKFSKSSDIFSLGASLLEIASSINLP